MANRIKAFMIFAVFLCGLYFLSTQSTGSEKVKVSSYNPDLGGINCYHDPETGNCVTTTANGSQWRDYVGRGAACPLTWKFGTRFRLPDNSEWVCIDRGEAIKYNENGIATIDLLVANPPYYLDGSVVKIQFINN